MASSSSSSDDGYYNFQHLYPFYPLPFLGMGDAMSTNNQDIVNMVGGIQVVEEDDVYRRQVFVGSLPSDVEADELAAAFDVHDDDVEMRRTRRTRGHYAFVTFADRFGAEDCISQVPHYIRNGTCQVVVRARRAPAGGARRGGNNTIYLDSDQSADEEEDLFYVPSVRLGPAAAAPVTSPTSARVHFLAEMKKKQEVLEKAYAAEFREVQKKLSKLDEGLELKAKKKEEVDRSVQSLAEKSSGLDVEMAGMAADKNLIEKRFVTFSQEHDAKVAALKEEVKQFKGEQPNAAGGAAGASNSDLVGSTLNDELECPCCFGQLAGQIYQCQEGHLICASCRVRLPSCPVCRVRYPTVAIRNRLAEKLAQARAAAN